MRVTAFCLNIHKSFKCSDNYTLSDFKCISNQELNEIVVKSCIIISFSPAKSAENAATWT